MDSVTTSPKKVQKKRTEKYSMCFLYNTGEALAKLTGLTVAKCNPTLERGRQLEVTKDENEMQIQQRSDFTTVSEKMSCNYCETEFESRDDQKRHYKSDWHRYNLRQRLKGCKSVSEEQFEDLSGSVSSISGSESDDDDSEADSHATSKPIGIAARFQRKVDAPMTGSSTDSESDDNITPDERARRHPKIFLKNSLGDLISIYRCVVYHKQVQPSTHSDMIGMVTDIPIHMKWAVLMSSGGHFAGAIFERDKVLVHKTFHRYVVRAKRGTTQSRKDGQGNAPKSAGASLRRYNEAALKEDVRDLLISWEEHVKSCDLIFLRAPGFNKKIFYSGKAPPLDKTDKRIRMIPFQTRRPTHNEVQRVHQMLASIECYGEEADIQDYVPLSPQLTYSPDIGQLIVVPDDIPPSPKHKKSKEKLGTSPLAREWMGKSTYDLSKSGDGKVKGQKEGLLEDTRVKGEEAENTSQLKTNFERLLLSDSLPTSGNSTASDSELVEVVQTISTGHLKEFGMSKKPKRKKNTRKRRSSIKHQQEPETNPLDEERYHLKNSLYTACKVGDAESLLNLLAVFEVPSEIDDTSKGQSASQGEGQTNIKVSEAKHVCDDLHDGKIKIVIGGENYLNVNEGQGQRDVNISDPEGQSEKDIKFGQCDLTDSGQDIMKDQVVSNSEMKFSSDNTNDGVQLSKDQDNAENVDKDIQDSIKTESMDKNICLNENEIKSNLTGCESAIESCKIGDIFQSDNLTDNKSNMKLNVRDSSRPTSREHSRSRHSSANDIMSPIIVTVDLLNEPIGDSETTLLMVAAKEGHKKLIQMLLKTGSNPAIKDKYSQTAYQLSPDKETRNEFRRFMAKYPNRYDYGEAKIPGPLTEEMEIERRKKEAEKKKIQKKAKQERDKEKNAEKAKKAAEEAEKKRFLSLTDRDKRAIAAEKRLQQQKHDEGTHVVLSRCYQCGNDMTGKVPFEYFDFKFCSPKCLKEHRQKSTKS